MAPDNTNGVQTGKANVHAQLAALAQMTSGQLRLEYERIFGEATHTHNRVWLIRRIAWRIQALAEGGLSERARRRAAELANDADLRLTAPSGIRQTDKPLEERAAHVKPSPRDNGFPLGSIITRRYKGAMLHVQVTAQGFAYQGTHYRSLSAVAKAITGSHLSGRAFFHLHPNGGDA